MRNTPYEDLDERLERERQVQMERIRRVMREQLTPLQRQTMTQYYLQGLNIPQIAQLRGVNKSTVSRTLHRAEMKVRKYLKY